MNSSSSDSAFIISSLLKLVLSYSHEENEAPHCWAHEFIHCRCFRPQQSNFMQWWAVTRHTRAFWALRITNKLFLTFCSWWVIKSWFWSFQMAWLRSWKSWNKILTYTRVSCGLHIQLDVKIQYNLLFSVLSPNLMTINLWKPNTCAWYQCTNWRAECRKCLCTFLVQIC